VLTRIDLLKIRTLTGLSQKDFGAKMGYSQPSIDLMEKGKRTITLRAQKAIQKFYKKAFDYVVD
jgi:transcriptional regulator with XRE-family HTH domain